MFPSFFPVYRFLFKYTVISTKMYDKWDDFNFDIVNFPSLDGDVPD